MIKRASEIDTTNSDFSRVSPGSKEKVCDLRYLTEMMGFKKKLIKEMMDVFLKQVPQELKSMENAISKSDYTSIRTFAHGMKSSLSIMGISELTPVLQEMQDLGSQGINIQKIKELNEKLNFICRQAIKEIEEEKTNYA